MKRRLHVVLYGRGDVPEKPPASRFDIINSLVSAGYCVTCSDSLQGWNSQPGQLKHATQACAACKTPNSEEQTAPTNSAGNSDNLFLLVLGYFANSLPPVEKGENSELRDITGLDPATVLETVEQVREQIGAPQPGGWIPWFPVIDYSRCRHCRQCLDFCLFDVFALSCKEEVYVTNPANCKTNCPACSRICPQTAIIFPKYKKGPLSGAEELPTKDENVNVDFSELFGEGVYSALRARRRNRKERFSTERDKEKALEERRQCSCMSRLQEKLDIPSEVLGSLSPQDASEARKKAEEKSCNCKQNRKPQEEDPPSPNESSFGCKCKKPQEKDCQCEEEEGGR